MKKKAMLLMALALALVMTVCMAACSGGGSGSGGSGSGGSGGQGSKAGYTFGTEKVRVWQSVSNSLIEIQVPITNNSDKMLYCRTVEYQLVNAKGEAVFTASGSDMAPLYLDPGDTGIIYHAQLYKSETPYSDDLKLKYNATIETPTWEVNKLDISNLTFEQPLGAGTGIVIYGDVTNTSSKDAENAMISIRLYDASGKLLGAAFGYASGTIAPGETGTFQAQRYEIEGGLSNIASYKAVGFATPDE